MGDNIDNYDNACNIDFREADMNTLVSEIYSNIPKNIGVNKIIPMPENEDDLTDDICAFIFQMLIEFYSEGICHYIKLKSIIDRNLSHNNIDYDIIKYLMKNEHYDSINFKNINEEILNYPKLWIQSLGFKLNILEENYLDYKEITNDIEFNNEYCLGNHFCKIIFSYNSRDSMYFDYKKINKPYHFLINNNFKKDKIKNINDVYALIFQNTVKYESEYKVYKISFSEIKIMNDCNGNNLTVI
jgi:hypothetical protein